MPSATRLARMVEASYRVSLADFQLRPPREVTLEVRQSSPAQMIADWQLNRTDVDLPFHPAASVWVFSIYFGLAHEVGHLLWHVGPLTLREAWASYFALHVLESQGIRRLLPSRSDSILLAKDRWLSLGILTFQRYAGSALERAMANIVHVWRKAGSNEVSAFLRAVGETMETGESRLVSAFSQHFDIPAATCRTWLRED